jgi:predicted acetyltransferase
MTFEYLSTPIDSESAERLAQKKLRLGLVDTADTAEFTAWIDSESRGFHAPRPNKKSMEIQLGLTDRRTTGVWDTTAADPESPVATVSSWTSELTVPGSTSVPAWAISAVTVAPTHRRQGVARALLEAELRTANSLGVPVAMLTVSEATIYSRYGFSPAAMMADWTINANRAKWVGPESSGRVHFVSLETLRRDGLALVERVRLETPGQIEFSGHLWNRLTGVVGDTDVASKLRAVIYTDTAGEMQGFAIYTVSETESNFDAHTLDLNYLVAATDDAYAGLWRYLLEMDLVGKIRAPLRSVTEPIAWQIADFRAARKTRDRDHLWTRILDVKAALEARRYVAPGAFVLNVADPLGFAEGRFLLEIEPDGRAHVTALDAGAAGSAGSEGSGSSAPAGALSDTVVDDAAEVSLTVNELSSLYLGGVSAVTLARAGRITAHTPGAVVMLDAAFRSPTAPWLSIWF